MAHGPGSAHAGIIRHMRPTRDGDLLIHQSSTNRIMVVELGGAATTRQAIPFAPAGVAWRRGVVEDRGISSDA